MRAPLRAAAQRAQRCARLIDFLLPIFADADIFTVADDDMLVTPRCLTFVFAMFTPL
jgi:hypothetical protein